MKIRILVFFGVAAFSPVQAHEKLAPPKNVAAASPDWGCARPAVPKCRDNKKCPEDPEEASTSQDYAIELKCIVEWMTDYSARGSKFDKSDLSLYEKERVRARYVIRKLSKWVESVHALGHKAVSEDEHLKSQQKYLSGILSFQKGDFDGAGKQWREALDLDPSNDDARVGIERIGKMMSGSAIEEREKK